ncbi:MAG: hypothetical protein IJ001_04905 [Oscillospiraceae bacterium]|nr:hypothetical protein [Oscillospiraceae bacterium]
MLAIQAYRFLIGTKIPFSDCPKIVQTFLNQQNLHYDRFLYYFHDNYGGLPKIMKDCPHIGPMRSQLTNGGELFYLSNIEEDTGCPETEIMSVVPKIHRRYGLSEAHIIYQDVDFFENHIPAIIQEPGNTPSCIKGPSITLYRDSVFPRWNSIDLRIVIHNGTETYDPAPYFEAMKQLLPGVRYMGFVECCLTNEEQSIYDQLNNSAAPLVQNACDHFEKHLPERITSTPAILDTPSLSVAPALKRFGKQYSYSYVKHEYGCFFIQKRTANGHYILLDIDVGPMFKGVGLLIRYVGAGFDHRIGSTFRYPQDQKDLETFFLQIFQVLASAEKEVIPALDAHYPPTPDWFAPIT